VHQNLRRALLPLIKNSVNLLHAKKFLALGCFIWKLPCLALPKEEEDRLFIKERSILKNSKGKQNFKLPN